MRPKGRARRVAFTAVVATLALGACGGEDVEGTSGKQIEQLGAEELPSEILGLTVSREDMTTSIEGTEDAFIDSVGLFGMRRDDLLQATLQISTFRDNAPIEKRSFQTSLVSQIGGSKAQSFRMGDTTVFRTTGRKQVISIWFEDREMYVLSVRDTFDQPRTLLRESLEVTA